MIASGKTLNGRASTTAKELEAALHKALQAHPECQGIRVLKLTLLENSHGIANWDAEFSTPPGTRYEYSNYAFGLLGRVVTKASGVSYERYTHDEILAKLHMDGSTFQFALMAPR